jgi:hypothetical protein
MINIDYKNLNQPQIERVVSDLKSKIDDGWSDGLQIYALGGFLEKLGKEIKDMAYSFAWDEYQKLDKKSMYGCEYQLKNTPPTYNFSEDKEWLRLDREKKDRESLLKRAFKAKEDEPVIKGDEVIPKVTLKSPSKETIAIKLKK